MSTTATTTTTKQTPWNDAVAGTTNARASRDKIDLLNTTTADSIRALSARVSNWTMIDDCVAWSLRAIVNQALTLQPSCERDKILLTFCDEADYQASGSGQSDHYVYGVRLSEDGKQALVVSVIAALKSRGFEAEKYGNKVLVKWEAPQAPPPPSTPAPGRPLPCIDSKAVAAIIQGQPKKEPQCYEGGALSSAEKAQIDPGLIQAYGLMSSSTRTRTLPSAYVRQVDDNTDTDITPA